MKQRKDNYKRFLAMLLAVVMVLTTIPATAFASGTDISKTDTGYLIDLEDKQFAQITSSLVSTVTGLEISGAEVTDASQDGEDVYISLSSATAEDAVITATFKYSTNRLTVTQDYKESTLEYGESLLSVTLTGKFGNKSYGSCTYNLHFVRDAVITDVPERTVESDTVEVYVNNEVTFNVKSYFKNATQYYLVENGEKVELEDCEYTFVSEEAGTYVLNFAAANDIGDCPKYVTVTVTVKEITSGVWVNKVSSNGSLNFITFTDENGNYIDDIACSLSGNAIEVTLPKTYNTTGKINANFNLTQNSDGCPFVSTKNGASGTSSGKAWDQRTTKIATTLSGGAAKTTFYYYNVVPKVTSNHYETFTIEYAVKNEIPTLADKEKTGETATISAGQAYELDLSNLFTDADGDALTYHVSVNGEAKTAADAAYSYTTNTAGEYTLVFTAHDGKGSSTDTYTVTLTVENVATKDSMTVKLPEGINPDFYVTNGFAEGADVLGDALTATKMGTADGYDSYKVEYPQNAEFISVRTADWGGMAFATEKDGTIVFTKTKFDTVEFSGQPLEADVAVKYGDYTAVKGNDGYLLTNNQTYSCTATPKDSDYTTKTQDVTIEETTDVCTVSLAMGYKSPKTITVPTGAKAQLFAYNQYYDFTEIKAKAAVDNGDGTTTYYFITSKTSLSYRATMEGKVTEAGYWMRNMTINFDDGKNSPKSNESVADNSVLVNVNGQNHLKMQTGGHYKLKGYRAWEIIKFSYQNEIITPDFNYNILSGSDVISLTPADSPSNGGSETDSDWMTVTALKEGTAVIEVSYDAIDITEGSWPGLYQASDADRTGLIIVTVGGEDNSVDFGIDCFSSQGGLIYKESNGKAWDAEFDTLYFTGDTGQLELKPTANSTVKEVAVSHDKGGNWDKVKNSNGTYTADIAAGNNIIRVTTEKGVAYQVVRGGKITTAVTEITGASDGDGLIEAGESVRITLDGLHTPIPKMAGNYNPGYKQNTEGDGGVHMVYNFLGDTLSGGSVQYTFGAEGNSIEVTIPEDYEEDTISLTEGYIALGVVGLTSFTDGGDSHRNIPDAGCATRDSKTTFHTRSILPDITLTIGEPAAPNTAPTVKADAVTKATVHLGQNYAINPETLFADKDGDVLTYQVSVNGGEAEQITAGYQFTPTEAGTYQLIFTADDGEAKVSHTITLTVEAADPPEDDDDLVFDIADNEIEGYVLVSFEDNGIREPGATGLKYPVALGTIVEPTKVPYKKGDSVAAVTVRLLKALQIDYTCSGTVESSFYLSSIKNFVVNNTPYDEMGEFHAGSGSGWMITLNDVFINRGASDFTVKNDDIIRWQYSCQLGADIGDNYAEELISNVENLIDAIGKVTENSGLSIEAARQAYEDLSAAQKKTVDNYEKLVAAERTYAELIATQKDRNAAQKVKQRIDAIGTVSLAKEKSIKDARSAYEKLTDTQKLLVDNYDILVKAENMLNHLKNPTHEEVYKETGKYIAGLGTPYSGSVGGDWMALGLARSRRTVPKGYFDNVVSYIRENINEDGQLHWYKSTENSRVVLGLTAAGYDPTDVDGHNLLDALNDMEYVKKQGINGPIWALIAFDSHDYEIPAGGDVTREKLVKTILQAQLEDGGWTLSGNISDVDMTGMALQALAPYYQTNEEVKTAVDTALAYLSKVQNNDGSFTGTDGVNAESMAQVIVALTALGINPETDSRFVKNGLSVVDALCSFAIDGGGFRHTADGKLDGMATEQGYYALTAYMRFLNGQTSLYDMNDVKIKAEAAPAEKSEQEDLQKEESKAPVKNKSEDKVKEESKNPTLSKVTTEESFDIADSTGKTSLETEDMTSSNKEQKDNTEDASVWIDEKTGISVSGVKRNVEVVVKMISDKKEISHLQDKLQDSTILGVWDIHLRDKRTGEKHQLTDSVTVKIPLKLIGDYSVYDGIAVVHYADDGRIEYLDFVIEDDYIIFDTIEFSVYAVVGYYGTSPLADLSKDAGRNTEDMPWIPWTIAGVFGVGLFAALTAFAKRKRNV